VTDETEYLVYRIDTATDTVVDTIVVGRGPRTFGKFVGPRLSPVPAIRVNGSNGPVTVARGEPLSVEIELAAGNQLGIDADWWALAETQLPPPNNWFHFDYATGSWLPGLATAYQGPCFDLAPYELLYTTDLPVGDYTFHFGIDMLMDGRPTLGTMYSSSVDVTVEP
jgi:hypothetical protein